MREAVKWYGIRNVSEPQVFRAFEDGEDERLRHTIRYHSPDGFEFGYGGSGPSDLSLNILADYAGWEGAWSWRSGQTPEEAGLPDWLWRLHNPFKFTFLANDRTGFEVTRDQITAWLREQGIEFDMVGV